MKGKRIVALLAALCLLTGCAGSASAAESTSAPVEESTAEVSAAQSAAEESEGEVSSASEAGEVEGPELTNSRKGSADGLKWKFRTEKYSTTESTGQEVYYYSMTYPVFKGELSQELNEYLEDNWLTYRKDAQKKAGLDDSYLDDYRESMDEKELEEMLPFYDQMNLDTVWVSEDYVSISGNVGFWSGGVHPYFYQVSDVLRRSDCAKMGLIDLVDPAKLPELVREHFPADAYADDVEYRQDMIDNVVGMAGDPEAFRLEEGGLRLFFNVGDAVPRLEILIPNEKLTQS